MSKGKVKMYPINKDMFYSILNEKNLSVLGISHKLPITDRTIRNILRNEQIQRKYILMFVEYLHVLPESFGSPSLEDIFLNEILELRSSGKSEKQIAKKLEIPIWLVYMFLKNNI